MTKENFFLKINFLKKEKNFVKKKSWNQAFYKIFIRKKEEPMKKVSNN